MPAAGEIFQYTFNQSFKGQTMETVFHFREISGLTTPANRRSVADIAMGILSTVQVTQLGYPSVIIKQMTPTPFDEDIYFPSSPVNGAQAINGTNTTVAAVITKRTGTAGKTHRGRFYLAGTPDNYFDPNVITAAGTTALQNMANALLAAFGPSGSNTFMQLGLYSRTIGGSSPFTVAGWQPVTRLDVQPIAGNQRRRRIGVGM